MSPELHQQVRRLFDEALDRPKAERLPFLEAACAGQPEVLEAVSRLRKSNPIPFWKAHRRPRLLPQSV
jgi:hypothetical protein